MKFSLKNIGIVEQADLTLGDLTIICGKNNTGKTYITYAIYGFLKYILQKKYSRLYRLFYENDIVKKEDIKKIGNLEQSKGRLEIPIADTEQRLANFFAKIVERYQDNIDDIFGSPRELFANTEFKISEANLQLPAQFKKQWYINQLNAYLICERKDDQNKDTFLIEFLNLTKEKLNSLSLVKQAFQLINHYLLNLYLDKIDQPIFIASTERTGAAIFQKELNFARNRLLDEMKELDRKNEELEQKNKNTAKLLQENYTDYALPVKDNVNFIRNLDTHSKKKSYLKGKKYEHILKNFSKKLLQGKYKIDKETNEIKFVPKKKQTNEIALSMDESSSTVRSLLDICFYLEHLAQPGSILMIDEPELNLHPENQRLMARLLAQLINSGLKIFITTHSDYLIKELSLLILLKNKKTIADNEKYRQDELLEPDQLKIYMTQELKKKITLKEATIDKEQGIDLESFNDTIAEMNRIEDRILYEEDD